MIVCNYYSNAKHEVCVLPAGHQVKHFQYQDPKHVHMNVRERLQCENHQCKKIPCPRCHSYS